MKIVNVVGARPNLMKVAPLMEAFAARPGIEALLVHTGQHYDANMSDLFFRQLGIPEPDLNLGVGSGSHAVQTAEIMKGFEPVLLEHRPDAVLVVGDVNSTIACGLVAVKLGIALVHVEAGLRSFDRSMPEEINRILTDAISDLLFCTEASGVENLRREGVAGEKIHLVGNVMIDTLMKHRARAEASRDPGRARARARRATPCSRCTGRRTSTTRRRSPASSTRSRWSRATCRWSSPRTRARARSCGRSASRARLARLPGSAADRPGRLSRLPEADGLGAGWC